MEWTFAGEYLESVAQLAHVVGVGDLAEGDRPVAETPGDDVGGMLGPVQGPLGVALPILEPAGAEELVDGAVVEVVVGPAVGDLVAQREVVWPAHVDARVLEAMRGEGAVRVAGALRCVFAVEVDLEAVRHVEPGVVEARQRIDGDVEVALVLDEDQHAVHVEVRLEGRLGSCVGDGRGGSVIDGGLDGRLGRGLRHERHLDGGRGDIRLRLPQHDRADTRAADGHHRACQLGAEPLGRADDRLRGGQWPRTIL